MCTVMLCVLSHLAYILFIDNFFFLLAMNMYFVFQSNHILLTCTFAGAVRLLLCVCAMTTAISFGWEATKRHRVISKNSCSHRISAGWHLFILCWFTSALMCAFSTTSVHLYKFPWCSFHQCLRAMCMCVDWLFRMMFDVAAFLFYFFALQLSLSLQIFV